MRSHESSAAFGVSFNSLRDDSVADYQGTGVRFSDVIIGIYFLLKFAIQVFLLEIVSFANLDRCPYNFNILVFKFIGQCNPYG